MPRVCTVCTSEPDVRQAIDAALIAGVPVTTISRRYSPLSATSITRHRGHLPATLAMAEAAKEVSRADDLLAQVDRLKNKAISLLLAAERAGDLKTALRGVAEARNCLELLLEVEGAIDRQPVVNIVVSSEWIALRGRLMHALQPFPEARLAVARQIEAGDEYRD